MAENKNSFILYKDIIHTVRKMPKIKQAELFMTILEYVNDENPVVKDKLVDIVFEPIKHQLKRDLKKWDKNIEKKSESGALGNLKRWHKDLYDKVVSGEITLEESQNIAKHRTAIIPIAPVAVSVIDTVIVNDNVSVSSISTETRKKDFKNIADWRNCKIYDYEELSPEFKSMYSQLEWESWQRFNDWITDNCSHIRQIETQIKIKDYITLLKNYVHVNIFTIQQIQEVLIKIDNYKPGKDKYNNVYTTLLGWLKKELQYAS